MTSWESCGGSPSLVVEDHHLMLLRLSSETYENRQVEKRSETGGATPARDSKTPAHRLNGRFRGATVTRVPQTSNTLHGNRADPNAAQRAWRSDLCSPSMFVGTAGVAAIDTRWRYPPSNLTKGDGHSHRYWPRRTSTRLAPTRVQERHGGSASFSRYRRASLRAVPSRRQPHSVRMLSGALWPC